MRFILLILFLLNLVVFSWEFYEFVERISPKGFRIKTSDYIIDDRITYVIFNVNINRTLERDGPIDFTALITESSGGQWIYDNINARVEGGWKISYRIDFFYDSERFNTTNKPARHISKDAELSYYIIDIIAPSKEKCSEHYRVSELCKESVTTVRGKPVCVGKRIFEEHFYSLDPEIWKIDARIPWDTADAPFVSFQNDPEVVYAHNGWLYINPFPPNVAKTQRHTRGRLELN